MMTLLQKLAELDQESVLQENGFVYTPKDWDELTTATVSSPESILAAHMGWNLACKYHKDFIKKVLRTLKLHNVDPRVVAKGDHMSVLAGNAEVTIKHDDDGIAVDVWPLEADSDSPAGSTWVTHHEIAKMEEDSDG